MGTRKDETAEPGSRLPFLDLLARLNRSKTRYVIAGGWAVILHGVPRMTFDLDLYLDLAPANLGKAARCFKAAGYRTGPPVPLEELGKPRARARLIRDRGMRVFQMLHPTNLFHPVDIFVRHAVPFREAWTRRVVVSAGTVELPLMCVPHLVKLKRIASRPKDLHDIQELALLPKPPKRR